MRMSTTLKSLALSAAMLALGTAQAQIQNCGLPAGSGGTLSTSQPSICADGTLWAPPTLSGYTAGLSRTEYIFQDPNDIVFNADSSAFGPRILEINLTGVFNPQAAGLAPGDQFTVTALHYNIANLQSFVQTLLNGSFLFTPCCTFAELVQGIDVCSVYNSVGILNGSDVANMNDWLASILAFDAAPALNNIIFSIDEINVQEGQPCTGDLPLCYATSSSITVNIACSPPACDPSVLPAAQSSTNLSNRVQLNWTPTPGAAACQVQGKRLPSGPQPTQNVTTPPYNSTNVPYSVAGAGTTWTWRVRCACQVSPTIIATAFSPYGDTFSVPASREMLDLESTDLLSIWPNPAQGFLMVETAQAIEQLEVRDLLGRLIHTEQPGAWAGSQIRLQLPALEPGAYLLVARFQDASSPAQTQSFSVQ
jgi:hypothetical protein